jgi:hypothetical protein
LKKEFSIIAACPACGAKNRVRLKTGSKVRIRCGRCGEQIALNRRGMALTMLWQFLYRYFSDTLPRYLLLAFNTLARLLGGLISPIGRLWGVLPWKVRKRFAWAAMAGLALFYLFTEGTVQLSSLLLLALLLVLATLAVVVAARGPSALGEVSRKLRSIFLRSCPGCGHRYFGWVKNCPNCGR